MVMCTLAMEVQVGSSVFKTSMARLLLALAVGYSVWSYQRFVGPHGAVLVGQVCVL